MTVNTRILLYVIIMVILTVVTLSLIIVLYNSSVVKVGIKVGDYAPNAQFTLDNGTTVNLSDFLHHGHYVLLYFAATWCSSCAYGVLTLSHYAQLLAARNVTVIILEPYNDLGYSGTPVGIFVNYFAGNNSRLFIIGYASLEMTEAYDPHGYPDIYYLISPNGRIIYSNVDLSNTINGLLDVVGVG
ncbi:peroxiredoxin family protein [Vulcanisaeta distributa]|uniref:Alkyl hydroperoxide reductase/ Thiol specific antioxidant/ Mal allergen n=1 Tax=Vulcanisaeta distributa (strain DSM 14429 / JCM 11212 / NBRC 100878 / IC-017) TaxID=572478 RepID=E1QSF9_VULDI|nr:alkyl hydroperoxide reductase/ Thiol specific antioxidant/ Mal allergen [Vulcanisaeta distributa DSM 14429]